MPNVTSDYCLSKLSFERKEARKITDIFGVDKYRNSRNFRNFDSNTYTEKSLNESWLDDLYRAFTITRFIPKTDTRFCKNIYIS